MSLRREDIAPARPPAAVALLWWSSFEWGEVTVGDYMSMLALGDALAQRGIDFDVIQRIGLRRPIQSIPEFAERERTFNAEEASQYRVVVFVCGPLPTEWSHDRERILAFSNACRIAAGGSLTTPEAKHHALSTFDFLFCRDGFERDWMDMALACAWPVAQAERGGVGACWRGNEGFYGARCADAVVESTANAVLGSKGIEARSVTTNINDWSGSISVLDAQFASLDFVLTTRLHGTLLSIRNRTPVITLDQQIGGGKVAAIVRQLGWPYFVGVNSLSYDWLHRTIDEALEKGWTSEHEAIRTKAIAASMETVQAVSDAIAAHLRVRQGYIFEG